ncbi:MAG: acetyl-CoA decarbonylase/synthase complex subunit gamma, partial [Candidatus Bathyarchaeia archaeon]
MTETETKRSIRELSPLDIYRLLPKITPPCEKCGEKNCLAFAAKVVNREVAIEKCLPILEEKYRAEYAKLKEILAPLIREITIGVGDDSVKIGGKLVMYRHEFSYHNPTPIAIDVTDEMPESEVLERVKIVEGFKYNYIGRSLNLDMIAIRSTSNDSAKFKSTAENVAAITKLPLILCSFNAKAIEAALKSLYQRRPLIYAATKDNWRDMAEIALKYNCPLSIFAPNDLNLLKSLVNTLVNYGVEDLVIDPGTFPEDGLCETINNFTMIRRNACKGGDELLGYPILGTPITVWLDKDSPKELLQWKEAYLASMLIARY